MLKSLSSRHTSLAVQEDMGASRRRDSPGTRWGPIAAMSFRHLEIITFARLSQPSRQVCRQVFQHPTALRLQVLRRARDLLPTSLQLKPARKATMRMTFAWTLLSFKDSRGENRPSCNSDTSKIQHAPSEIIDGAEVQRPKITIPKRGEKDFEPLQETVNLQEMMLQNSRQALFDALQGVRGMSSYVAGYRAD